MYSPSTSASGKGIIPQTYGNDSDMSTKQRVMEILDNLESHVEKLRRDATKLEEEKDVIMGSLDAVKLLPVLNDLQGLDRDEAQQYLERIIERCHTVAVNVYTQRDQSQEDALHQVNQQIDHLIVLLKADHEAARARCLIYMNSSSSQSSGVTDKHFESALLGCTIDDQKRVKKRLLGLLKYLDKMGIVSEV